MAYTIHHTQIGRRPHWYHLEFAADALVAALRANSYALDHGGYTCVKDSRGRVIFGTDPAELDRAIACGINRNFTETSRADIALAPGGKGQ